MGSAYSTNGMRNLTISHLLTGDATLEDIILLQFDEILFRSLSSSASFPPSYLLLSVLVAVGNNFQAHQLIE